MGGPGSGRQAEAPLSDADYAKLTEGISLDTSEGLLEYVQRLGELNLKGKIPGFRYRQELEGVKARRSLVLHVEAERRVKRLEQVVEGFKQARAGGAGGDRRDIGPPPDSLGAPDTTGAAGQ